MQSSSQIITTNKPTPSLFYKPDALPVAPKNSVKAMKGISKDMIHKIKHRDSLDWHLAQHITGWKYRALTIEPLKIYDKMWHSSKTKPWRQTRWTLGRWSRRSAVWRTLPWTCDRWPGALVVSAPRDACASVPPSLWTFFPSAILSTVRTKCPL